MNRLVIGLVSLTSLALLAGCGGNATSNNPTPTTPTPTATTPPPSGTNTTPPPPPNPTPAPVPSTGPNAGMYQVQLVSTQHPQDTVGQLTVDPVSNNGDINVKFTSATIPTANFSLIFCPFGGFNRNCFDVGSFSSDTSGNVNASLKFPKTGTWAGVFSISKDNAASSGQNTALWVTEPSAFAGNFTVGQNYRVALEPESQITGGITVTATPAPLASGLITISGDMLHAELHGAAAATTYTVSFCANGGFTSSCNQYGSSGTFTTDGSGNGSADVKVYAAPSEVFFLDPINTRGQGYMTAFVVQ